VGGGFKPKEQWGVEKRDRGPWPIFVVESLSPLRDRVGKGGEREKKQLKEEIRVKRTQVYNWEGTNYKLPTY